MTIDERLEKLVERHEALTQTVELVASFQRASDARVDRLAQAVEDLVKAVNQDGQPIRALTYVAELHDRRLTKLEGGERQ